jgi:HKD family nuclease
MKIINQPKDGYFFNEIASILTASTDCRGHTFYLLVAYARKSGVIKIKRAMEYFKERGGNIIAVVGLDQKHTTWQGLHELINIVDKLYVYHNEDLSQTFHPKVYIREINKVKADVLIGSSNLTAGGMSTNYEVNYYRLFNLKNNEDEKAYSKIKDVIKSYSGKSTKCCMHVDDENKINELRENDYLGDEGEKVIIGASSKSKKNDKQKNRKLFGKEKFKPTPAVVIRIDSTTKSETIPTVTQLGEGFWKKLSKNDVSLEGSPGQIIIPIGYINFFPEFNELIETPSGGGQQDVFFNVYYNDKKGGVSLIKMVRAILYIPSPTHPRPNRELRFTFHNRSILEKLEKDDILIFRRTDNPNAWFDVVHLGKSTKRYNSINLQNKRYGMIKD